MKLHRIARKNTRFAVGLMSGTSHDGIDAALVKITNCNTKPKIQLIKHLNCQYSKKLRTKIGAAFTATTSEICKLNFELGEVFAQSALDVVAAADLAPQSIDFIASHGQTIFHIPPAEQQPGATLQIGEAAIIAERTGIITLSDFRPRDMAVGGHGAPLVPYADHVLFSQPEQVRAIQNIGGIANVTIVPHELEEVIAFDTGPGNALIDEVVKIITHHKQAYDVSGKMAAQGKVDAKLLTTLMRHAYFTKKPPKSTGRELFGKNMAQTLVKKYTGPVVNLVATLTKFTAVSIHDAYAKFVFPRYPINEIILCGGGCYNPVLVNFLCELFQPTTRVSLIDDYGIPALAKEAISFALLGNATIAALPSNVPSATGAAKNVILGKISLV